MFSAAIKTKQVSSAANYIEDVFSTYLYTGNGSTQTITNGIDLSGQGGLVWVKNRGTGSTNHLLMDTARTGTSPPFLSTNNTAAQVATSDFLSFNSNGFSFLTNSDYDVSNQSGQNYASWTFRKQPKFFDVVTYTGDGASTKTISHSLGSTPGFVIIKNMDSTGNWMCWHNSFAATDYIALNTTGAKNYAGALTDIYKGVSSTTVTIGSNAVVNNSGYNYVMYVFAHDAGGFGLTGTDNVISCGSYTGNGSTTGPVINLGYEPQWVLLKNASSAGNDWVLLDNMRGIVTDGIDPRLFPNLSDAENTGDKQIRLLATGFQPESLSSLINANGATIIYIAIRRGPMKTPTTGTSVFSPNTSAATTGTAITTNFPIDLQINKYRTSDSNYWVDRLRGVNSPNYTSALPYLVSNSTAAEVNANNFTNGWDNNGFLIPGYYSGASTAYWNFRRAPGFFDEVCYTGTGVARTISHNLGVAPEMIIVKNRTSVADPGWYVGAGQFNSSWQEGLFLNTTGGLASSWYGVFDNTAPTSSVFSLNDWNGVNDSGATYVAYLFASCPGVSKIGSYSGTGATQTISCGFAARFVMIKRINGTGGWFVWDTARGMVAGTDPRLALNSTAAEANNNWVYTDASGFQIVTTDATVNASGGSYIYLCIA